METTSRAQKVGIRDGLRRLGCSCLLNSIICPVYKQTNVNTKLTYIECARDIVAMPSRAGFFGRGLTTVQLIRKRHPVLSSRSCVGRFADALPL